jgi:ribosomal protein L29
MTLKFKQIKEMGETELRNVLAQTRGQLRQFRFLAGQGELKQVHTVKQLRKTIARISTALTERKRKDSPLTGIKKQG